MSQSSTQIQGLGGFAMKPSEYSESPLQVNLKREGFIGKKKGKKNNSVDWHANSEKHPQRMMAQVQPQQNMA